MSTRSRYLSFKNLPFIHLCLLLGLIGPNSEYLNAKKKPEKYTIGQNEEAEPLPDRSVGGFLFQPLYEDTLIAGSESGGDREERRAQNRIWFQAQAGAWITYQGQAFFVGTLLSGSYERDFHYYGADDRTDLDWTRPGPSFLFLGSGRWAGQKKKGSAEAASQDLQILSELRQQSGSAGWIEAQAGYMRVLSDPEGILYQGETPALGVKVRLSELLPLPLKTETGIHGWALERQRVEGAGRRGADRYTGASITIGREAWQVTAQGGYYRAPGRAAEPDLSLTQNGVGLWPGPVLYIPTGQSARPDRDVRYYGLRYEQKKDELSWQAMVYYNMGREIAVTPDGIRNGFTRKSIHGYIVYGALAYEFGAKQTGEGPACGDEYLSRRACAVSGDRERTKRLQLGGFRASRDRDESDLELKGYGSLSPGPQVLGGPASIILTGPTPAGERPAAMRNYQSGRVFADAGYLREDESLLRDNQDPASPQYDNAGLNMLGLNYSMMIIPELKLDGYINYGEYLEGQAQEAILALAYLWRTETFYVRVYASVSGARYKAAAWRLSGYTGLLEKPHARYYSRYILGADFKF